MVSWSGDRRRGLIPVSLVEKRWQESLCRQWWLEAGQVICSHCPRKLSAIPWIMGAAAPFSLCRVSHNKVEITSVRSVKQAWGKRRGCVARTEICEMSAITFCRNPFPRAKTCLVLSQVRWKVEVWTGCQFGNAAGSLLRQICETPQWAGSVSSCDTGSAPMQPGVFWAQVIGCSSWQVWAWVSLVWAAELCVSATPRSHQARGVSPFPVPVPCGLCFPGECFLLRMSPLSSPGSFWLCLHSSGVNTPFFCPHSFPKALLFCKLDSDYFVGLLHSEKSGSKSELGVLQINLSADWIS